VARMPLLPHDEKFFELFLRQAEIVASATKVLRNCATDGAALHGAEDKIHELEERADDVLHDIHVRLNRTFVLPLDPEDIHGLASALDDIVDEVELTVNRLAIYHLDPVPPGVRGLAGAADDCAQAVCRAFRILKEHELHKKDEVRHECEEINRIQQELEAQVRGALGTLFDQERDPITLIKVKEIYERLERVGDCCELVADTLDTVIAKNS
jgi:uncharacterized protein